MIRRRPSGSFCAVRSPTLRTLLLALVFVLPGCSAREETDAHLAMLEEGSAGERLAALQALSRSPKSLELPRLRLLLEDPSPAVRALALSIAAQRREPQLVEWIGPRVLDSEPDVRRAALGALARFDTPARDPYLVAAYPLQDLEGRAAIVDALEHRDENLMRVIGEEARSLWERNLSALRAGGVAELVGALDLLGRSGRPEAVERLVRLLESDSTRIVVAAARGLALSESGEGAREALEALLGSEIPERRAAAEDALRRLGEEVAGREGTAEQAERAEAPDGPAADSDALWARAEDEQAPFEDRQAAIRALGELEGEGARLGRFARKLMAKIEARRSSDAGEKEADEEETGGLLAIAAEGALARGDRELGERLAAFAEDPLPALRALALRAGAPAEPTTLEAKASADPSLEVRLAAIDALARKQGGEIAATLALLAESPTEAGERALAELEQRGDADALLKVFRKTGSARAAAALGRLGKKEAARPLLDPATAGKVTPEWLLALKRVDAGTVAAAARLHLAHDRPEIRAAAAELLRERCDWEAMPLLRALASQDYYVEVRTAADEAVRAIRACPAD